MPTFQEMLQKIKTVVIGRPRSHRDHAVFHKLTLVAFLAWVGLGADGMSSSCYGPEEAFKVLHDHPSLAIFVALATALTVFIIISSYSQIVELFPAGGGGYLVASKLLSPRLGMLSGCALIVDYALTVTVSIASGMDAFLSFLPPEVHRFKVEIAMLCIVVLTVMNLRGVKESVIPLVPIFLVFILTHLFAILYGIFTFAPQMGSVVERVGSDLGSATSQLGVLGVFMLILHSYSMGAGTFTGIEAVSNAIPNLRDPKVETAKKTMRYMAISLSFLVLGLTLGYLLYQVSPERGKTLNAILFEKLTSHWGPDLSYAFRLITLTSEAALLVVAAQTGFLGGPRVMANMAMDRWFPGKFTMLSDRFVAANGIVLMGASAMGMMLLTRGSVGFLVVLYSINVFITFVLSQLGMVRHWWLARGEAPHWRKKLCVNGLGLVLTGFILASLLIVKFREGGWITLLVTGALIVFALLVKRHYDRVGRTLTRLDKLTLAADSLSHSAVEPSRMGGPCDPEQKTAVLLVGGFNGIGLHTLLRIVNLFDPIFRNFIFVEVGVIDAGNFKGAAEITRLTEHVRNDVDRYIDFTRRSGHNAEGLTAVGVDIVDEVTRIASKLLPRFPQAVFFGGQLVFSEEMLLSRWLHNNIVFAVQRRLSHEGIPMVILPVRI